MSKHSFSKKASITLGVIVAGVSLVGAAGSAQAANFQTEAACTAHYQTVCCPIPDGSGWAGEGALYNPDSSTFLKCVSNTNSAGSFAGHGVWVNARAGTPNAGQYTQPVTKLDPLLGVGSKESATDSLPAAFPLGPKVESTPTRLPEKIGGSRR